ncbi:MAG: hypothetical protein ACXABY_06445 [Candidatus Thorarchaeota archaeon]|jgi:hypothetical protein
MSTLHLGVIGCAGRKEDTDKMNKDIYKWMFMDVKFRIAKLLQDHNKLHLHSGGAAWSDHLVVSLMKSGVGDKATLHLPTTFMMQYKQYYGGGRTGKTANYYHSCFSEKMGEDTLASLAYFITDPRVHVIEYKGFLPRNIGIAEASDALIAHTWHHGTKPKPKSGTLHTWNHCKANVKIHVPLEALVAHYAKQH